MLLFGLAAVRCGRFGVCERLCDFASRDQDRFDLLDLRRDRERDLDDQRFVEFDFLSVETSFCLDFDLLRLRDRECDRLELFDLDRERERREREDFRLR